MNRNRATPFILLINPWITDFAAYDFWMRPIGLLRIGSWLRNSQWKVELRDCLDRRHPSVSRAELVSRPNGTGRFFKTLEKKPEILGFVPRRFGRYGIPAEAFRNDLGRIERPDAVLVTSSMTYWYPGVQLAIRLVKEEWPGIVVVLGGRYATLCPEHAKEFSGADYVLEGSGADRLPGVLESITGSRPDPFPAFHEPPFPAHDLYRDAVSAAVVCSVGCPFRCTYCATRKLHPDRTARTASSVAEELERIASLGIRDIAFYDDALLADSGSLIEPLLERVIQMKAGLRFHTPNAMHAKLVTPRNADLMKKAGFGKVFLGFESSDASFQLDTGAKIEPGELAGAAACFRDAGFEHGSIAAYIIAGHPAQKPDMLREAVYSAADAGVVPVLAEYSPVPGTPDFSLAERTFHHQPGRDPLLHNSSIIRYQHPHFEPAEFEKLRLESLAVRAKMRGGIS